LKLAFLIELKCYKRLLIHGGFSVIKIALKTYKMHVKLRIK